MEHFLISLLILFLSFLSFLSLTLFILYYKHKSLFSYPNTPPGAIGIPIFGESLEFFSAGWKGEPEKFIFDRLNKYKSDVFKTSLFGVPAAIFCGSVCNKFLFSNENKLVTAWWPDSVNKIFPSSTQTSSKEEAKKLKKLLPQFLKRGALQRYIGIMDEIAQRHFASFWENREQVLVFPLAKKFTFSLACRLFVSIEDEIHVERLSGPFQHIAAGIMSMPIDLPGTPFNRGIKASKFIRKELLRIVKQRKSDLAEGKASATQDILSHMLLTCDDNGKCMNESDIADKILGLLIGGHDTASAACTFIVYFLADLPHIYHGVYKEQMEIAKAKGPGELLNWDDIQKMKYSWNVACEVLRLASPVQGAFREVINDFVFNGFYIPKGWKVYLSINSTHKNPEYFPEPYKFEPSRFEGCGPPPFAFVPFGGGPRMCPGKEYARLQILVFIHNLVKRFKWSKLLLKESIIVNPMPIPQNGLPVRLFPHQKQHIPLLT